MTMNASSFDIITVGGGLAASTFAKSMAERGANVLILEREERFKDRVRGEFIVTWGVAEAQELGILNLLRQSCAIEVPWIDLGFGPRDLRTTTPQQLPGLSFSHPEMQETLLAAAENAGAVVRRGVSVQQIEPGPRPRVMTMQNGHAETISARLVTAADGRNSVARKWLGFTTKMSGDPFLFSGVLLSGVPAREDAGWFIFNPELGLIGALVSQGRGRFRAYLGYPSSSGYRLNGKDSVSLFLSESAKVAPVFGESYSRAQDIGPLATFDGGNFWVERPYRNGVALLGDAAGTSDPSFGQGMSLSLRDARTLRDELLSNSDWDAAGHRYAERHDAYFQRCRTACGWLREMFQEQTPEAAARRLRALPLIANDPTRVPDHLFSGPEMPLEDAVRARFFGES
jgi:2-polyprenyl-6-methoxyphenol hydroxylase-like FAD-dependent oxidoreductase